MQESLKESQATIEAVKSGFKAEFARLERTVEERKLE